MPLSGPAYYALRIFAFRKEIPTNTKENITLNQFCSLVLQEGPINLIPSLKCFIFTVFSKDTHIGQLLRNIAIWPYSHMAIWRRMWPIWVTFEKNSKNAQDLF